MNNIPATMNVIEISKPGGPDVLVPAQRPVPAPKAGEVLVKVAATGVNGPDMMQRKGLYPAPAGAPDLLVSDVVLATGMNGIELANAARVMRPGLPVVFMSGYTAVPEAQQRLRETGAPLLFKPFTTPQLERAVNVACASIDVRS